jgi:hypothetical protein
VSFYPSKCKPLVLEFSSRKKQLKNPFDFIGRPGYLAWQHRGDKNTGLNLMFRHERLAGDCNSIVMPKSKAPTAAKPPRGSSGDARSLASFAFC